MLGKDDTKEKQMQQELFNHLKLSKKNREIAEQYRTKITTQGIVHPQVAEDAEHIYYVYVLTMEDRDGFRAYM